MYKKLLYIMLIITVFFPPTSTYLALKTDYENGEKEIKFEQNLLIKQGFQQIKQSNSLLQNCLKSVSQIRIQQFARDPLWLKRRFENGDLERDVVKSLEDILKASKLKGQAIVLFGDQGEVKSIGLGEEHGLTAIMAQFEDSGFQKNSQRRLKSGDKPELLFPADINLINFGLKKGKKTLYFLSVRSEKSVRSVAYLYINEYCQAALLFHSDQATENIKTAKTLAEVSNKIVFGVMDKMKGEVILPESPQISPTLLKKLDEKIPCWSELPEMFNLGNYQVFLSAGDVREDQSYFAIVRKAPDFKSKNPVIALLFLVSCVLFTLISERMLFDRGPNVSLKILIPVIFMFMVVQPLFASLYYLADYFDSEYKSHRNKLYQDMFQSLKTLDIETFDNTKVTVNRLRALESLEKIMDFVSLHDPSNLERIARRMMERLKINGKIYYDSLWLTAQSGNFIICKWGDEYDVITENKADNPVAEVFKNRFQEIVRYRKTGKIGKKNSEKIDKNALKNEFARDFLVNVVGPDSFFEFRKYSEFIIKTESSYVINYIVCIPISYEGKPFGFIGWHLQSKRLQRNFPIDKLQIERDPPLIAIIGTENYNQGAVWKIARLKKHFPEVTQQAINSSNSRSKITRQISYKDGYLVIGSLPGNYSNFAIASSRFLETFKDFKEKIVNSFGPKVVATVVLAIFAAWLCSLYLIFPIRQLTVATNQIDNGDFSVRIDENHPDDFADISQAFNTMAKRLDEGQILKGFVSESVRKEVASHESGELSAKAEQKNATIIFSALSNFKELLDSNDAAKVFELLQQHLEAGVNATAKFGGEIDKMIEDKLMIVFEHDSETTNYCEAAILVASEINVQLKQATGVSTVAGINSGLTVAGIMGAEKARLARTVVGDPVNLAARLAAEAAKLGEDSIVVSEAISKHLPCGFAAEKLPINNVKGKTQSISAFRVFKGESINEI